ncbi:MAG: hypothetical protein AB1664_17930 [Thermodesulfobacteriota bacterium]
MSNKTKKQIYSVGGVALWALFVAAMAPDLTRFETWACFAAGYGAIVLISKGLQGSNSYPGSKCASEAKKES